MAGMPLLTGNGLVHRNTKVMKYTYRYDIPNENYGWYVVIELYATRRYFSDQAYGGKEESFLAALKF